MDNLTVLRVDAEIGGLLQAAFLADQRRAADGLDDGEGAKVWPPPGGKLREPIESPLSTPPSSPDASAADLSLESQATPKPPAAAMRGPARPPSARALKQRAGKKSRQARGRQEEARDPLWTQISQALSRRWSQPQPLKTTFSVTQLPVAGRGFQGKRPALKPRDRSTPWTLPELEGLGFRLIEWDGRCACFASEALCLAECF